MSARRKLLFVTHTVDPMGGAARSLRELLQAYDHIDADLVLPRSDGSPEDAAIRAFFGQRLGRIVRAWLPWEMCYRGRPELWQSVRRHLAFPLLWRATRERFHRFVVDGGYDAVHLNSIVLHPLARADGPYLLHVREILDDTAPAARLEAARKSAARARGVVFIDEATRAPFRDVALRRSIVLNNPVDMTAVGNPPADAASRLGGEVASLTIFSMIGTLIPEKGVAIVIDAFRGLEAANARLLLVGSGQAAYVAELQRRAGGDRRIVFWGSEPDVAKIYALSDYVLRGEAYPCVGRTVYEALYAGCAVIVPGDAAHHSFFEYDRFAARISLYRPTDRDALLGELRSRVAHKIGDKKGESNVAGYVAAFDEFVLACTSS